MISSVRGLDRSEIVALFAGIRSWRVWIFVEKAELLYGSRVGVRRNKTCLATRDLR